MKIFLCIVNMIYHSSKIFGESISYEGGKEFIPILVNLTWLGLQLPNFINSICKKVDE